MEISLPGSMAGTVFKQEIIKPEGMYENLRALDLRYAIQWNRDAGKNLPPVPEDADKKSLVSYCELYNIDLNKCQTYVDAHNLVRIARPPSTYQVKEEPKEQPKEEKLPEKMNPFELKKYLKDNGIDTGEAKKKEELLALLNSGDASTGG